MTINTFILAITSLGFVVCEDDSWEDGYQKIALFSDDAGQFTHASVLVAPEVWKSKLGSWSDIEHSLDALHGGDYGVVSVYMKRAIETK